MLGADCGGIRFVSVYVPNGREVGTDFYDRKLVWLQTLHDWLAATQSPERPLVVLGDFNVAPDDIDVWDPTAFVGATHVTRPSATRSRSSKNGASRTRSAASTASRTSSSATGTTAPATSTSTAACASTSCSRPVRWRSG